jgi:transposase-like protein
MSKQKVAKRSATAKMRLQIPEGPSFDPAALLAEVRIELHTFASSAGLFIINELMRLESEQIAGEHYARDTDIDRWGSQTGFVRLGGQKLAVDKPRMRSKTAKREVPLVTYRTFQNPEQQTEQIYERLIGGLSTRRYQRTVDAMLEGYGASKSAVSRQMVEATAQRLEALLERDLSSFDVRVLVIDAVHVGSSCHATVLGIDSGGNKLVLGFREGATENATVVSDLLADLVRRGLPNERERALLAIIDGSKALAKAVRATFGSRVAIQRCQIHKLRNVVDYLPDELKAEYRRKITAAYAMRSHGDAERALRSIIRELMKINVSAANSLAEGLEETLTIHRLGVPEELRRSLRSTNMIESTFSHSRHLMKNVRRWRDSAHTQRWTATVFLEAEKRFRRIHGYKHMPALINALTRSLAQ